mgnify:CR=1 FL=1
MADEKPDTYEGFGTKAVHSGTNHVGDAVNTPIFQSSTYKLTDERYAGWAAGAQHTLLYARLSSCLLYTSPSPRDKRQSRMPSSA